MNTYREPAPTPKLAPRAPWYRRIKSLLLRDRLAIRAKRHWWHARFPWATWRQCEALAKEQLIGERAGMVGKTLSDDRLDVTLAEIEEARPTRTPS